MLLPTGIHAENSLSPGISGPTATVKSCFQGSALAGSYLLFNKKTIVARASQEPKWWDLAWGWVLVQVLVLCASPFSPYFSDQQEGASLTPASLQVTATDADSGPFGLLSYSLGAGLGASGSPPFRIDAHSGEVCTTRILDRDQGPSSFDFTVTAIDGVSKQTLATEVGVEFSPKLDEAY